ncbi:unnamed protein product [Effrenium voratum]|uniref:UspA domain-containing protein n=1 Tax=Effrenium voratum TaxID=2562239 RepID=A0AA36MKG6_9DINO|nr:unnamed protein product [Effrenium voratum]
MTSTRLTVMQRLRPLCRHFTAVARKPVTAVSCVDGQPQSVAAARLLSRMLQNGDSAWVYRAVKSTQQASPEEAEKHSSSENAAQSEAETVAKALREATGLGEAIRTHVHTVMSPGAAVISFVGRKGADMVAMGCHGPGRVLHRSLASYLMQSYGDIRLLVCPLQEWRPSQEKGLKYTVVYDGCTTSQHALEVLASYTTSEDTVEILHAHVAPQPASRGKFRSSTPKPSEEEVQKAAQDSMRLFNEAKEILKGVKEVKGTHIEVLPGQQLGEMLLDTAIRNSCDVLVAGTKCMPGIGTYFDSLLKGRTVVGVLKSSLTTHLLNNAVEVPVLYIN